MKKILPGLLAATLAATFIVSSALPLNAAPVSVPKPTGLNSDVVNVQYNPELRRNRVPPRHAGFQRRGNAVFYNGREGSRFRREGYRRYNGWWFPAAAFTTGAIVSRPVPPTRAGFQRRGNTAFYNGREGSRFRREGYRRYNGWWFPAAAFTTGAIVGGTTGSIVGANRPAANASAHVQWCYNRFRSYRSSDNTFQPTRGPRQECVSPYS